MRFLKGKQYLDAKNYAGECESVVVVAKGQGKGTAFLRILIFDNSLIGEDVKLLKKYAIASISDVQGTCKYGTRVDYILASPNSRYKFVPGSYGVISSKGTSDHHIVKVDIVTDKSKTTETSNGQQQPRQRVVKMDKDSSKGIWRTNL